jgi:hydroxyethylthiazole kinase-like uncharacterized protein yjeF
MNIVTTAEIRDLEVEARHQGLNEDDLINRAGLLIASYSSKRLESSESVVILVGSGNNGSDGIVAALHLRRLGHEVLIYLCNARLSCDLYLKQARETGANIIDGVLDKERVKLTCYVKFSTLVIDAVIGTGHSRPLSAETRSIFDVVRQQQLINQRLWIIAIDVPSGLNADTGAMDVGSLHADVTITLGYPKRGLFLLPGAELSNQLLLGKIGLERTALHMKTPTLLTSKWVQKHLPVRSRFATKRSYGRVLVVAGSREYPGAAYLASMGAARTGAGFVTLITSPDVQQVLASKLVEITHLIPPENGKERFGSGTGPWIRQQMKTYDALVIGCGLGRSTEAQTVVRETLLTAHSESKPTVIDADALNTLALTPEWWKRIPKQVVLTPHSREMSRLLGVSLQHVEESRWEIALEAARRWGVVILLKGPFSVIASPSGELRITPFANPALATAGTGDVLAGVVGSLLARNLSPLDAASIGAAIHGVAGELLQEDFGDQGALATDLLARLPVAIGALETAWPLKELKEASFLHPLASQNKNPPMCVH